MIVFGLEGTAWNLSAALVDERGVLYEKSATYEIGRASCRERV
jgi:tRNA A37 threonylcarbamoyltransferase TsaD